MQNIRAPQRGFTLVELSVALAVAAVLAALALPSFSSALERQRVKAQAADVQGLLTLAKAEALKSGQPVHLSSSQAQQCFGARVGAPCDCTAAPTEPSACSLGSVRWRASSAQNTFLATGRIDPVRGTVIGSGALTLSTEQGQSFTTGITPLGRVFACAQAAAQC